MKKYSKETRSRAIDLRLQGKTYQEINASLNQQIPKSTASYWFRGLELPPEVQEYLLKNIEQKLTIARKKAVEANKVIRDKFRERINSVNLPICRRVNEPEIAKIALAMLCLGEASKSTSKSGFYLGNSDPRIVILFMKLLERCFNVNKSKFRFTIQCRADQDVVLLEKYWRNMIGVSSGQFYSPRIDPRTVGKPTKDISYRGVLRVDYIDKKVQLELESLANLIYNQTVE